MTTKTQAVGEIYGTDARQVTTSSYSYNSYNVNWVNTSTTADSPIISVENYYANQATSKVLYRANSSSQDSTLLTQKMSVYINQGPSCDNTAANYKSFTFQASADFSSLCTHKIAYLANTSVVSTCSALTSKTTCDA